MAQWLLTSPRIWDFLHRGISSCIYLLLCGFSNRHSCLKMDALWETAGALALFGSKKEEASVPEPDHNDDPAPLEIQEGNRFASFAAPSTGRVKWYVDGCSYFWAVSVALEQAQESIFILDWWLSP